MNRATKTIVLAQLLGTSLWFSTNGVAKDLIKDWGIDAGGIGLLTSAVQLGFIASTIALALFGLADRFAAAKIFAASALLGAIANAGVILVANNLAQGIAFRFVVGLALGGIYPIGMKLVVSWSPDQAGPALAWLVGMLTLGTASPHLIRGVASGASATTIVLSSSGAALVAGILIVSLGTGPHAAKPAPSNDILGVFRIRAFRSAALGYFGHMWELYAFWTVTPILARELLEEFGSVSDAQVSLASFVVIAVGAVGCVWAGALSRTYSSAAMASVALAISGLISLIYPLLAAAIPALAILALLIWGLSVVADSAQFSAVSAAAAPKEQLGGALALQNAIGFLITIGSISLMSHFIDEWGIWSVWLLSPGPVLGLLSMRGHRALAPPPNAPS